MNTFRGWTTAVLCGITVITGVIVSVNVVVDAYGIMRTDFSRQCQVPNMNFIKIKYLTGNKNKYDSFIFGSSRVENIDEKKIAGGRYYNMTYPVGLPKEHLDNIRYLLREGVSIKNLLIGLDDFSYCIDPLEHGTNLDLQPHPAVSGKKPEVFYAEYFCKLRGVMPQLEAYIRHNYTLRGSRDETRFIYDMYGSGRILCPTCDEDIERNVKAHREDARFSKMMLQASGDNLVAAIDSIREISVLAKKNHINLTVFINPLHKTTYAATNLKQFALFKKELATVAAYYDFSGLNSITTDNYYYYETSHYRPMVGDLMLKVMFGAPAVTPPRDFGFLVTRENVASHIKKQCLEVERHRNDLHLSGANTSFADTCEQLPDSSSPAREQGRGKP
jgi:hypothetical protein